MYEVRKALSSDTEGMFSVLEKVLVDSTKTTIGQERDRTRIYNSIKTAIDEAMALVLLDDGEIVGTMLLRDKKGVCVVLHSNILGKYKSTIGSAMLNDVLLNDVFENKDVYIHTVSRDYQNLVESVGRGLYKIKDDIRFRVKEVLDRRA